MKSIVNKITILCTLSILLTGSFNASAAPLNLGKRFIVVCKKMHNVDACAQLLQKHNTTVVKKLPLINGVAISLLHDLNPENIAYIEGISRIESDPVHVVVGERITWNIQKIGVNQIWDMTTGIGATVGILDTGIDPSHPDLKGNILGGIDTIKYRSWNDMNGHGTHVAGIVAAIRNNGIGVVGVTPGVGLYAVKVLNSNGVGYTSDIIEGIGWCIRKGCNVINMSFGSYSYNQSLQDAIEKAYSAGIVLVAAAGNDGTNAPLYPSAYNHVLAVSATDQNDNLPRWSNYGSYIDFAAPGVLIYSTYKKGLYAIMSGTSMASPHVAGVAALRISQYIADGISFTPDRIEEDMAATAYNPDRLSYDEYYGFGILDTVNLINLPLTQ